MKTAKSYIKLFMEARQNGDNTSARVHIRNALAVIVNEKLDEMRQEIGKTLYEGYTIRKADLDTQGYRGKMNSDIREKIQEQTKRSQKSRDKYEVNIVLPVNYSTEKFERIITSLTGLTYWDTGMGMGGWQDHFVPVDSLQDGRNLIKKLKAKKIVGAKAIVYTIGDRVDIDKDGIKLS